MGDAESRVRADTESMEVEAPIVAAQKGALKAVIRKLVWWASDGCITKEGRFLVV